MNTKTNKTKTNMSDIPVEINSVLNSDLSSVDSGFPVLEACVIDCTISEMVVKQSKKDPAKANLHIKLTTAMPAKTRDGVLKAPGFPLNDIVGLNATEKYNPAQRLKQIKEAATGDGSGPFGQPESYIGKTVTVRIKIETSAEYGDQNRIQAYVKRNA